MYEQSGSAFYSIMKPAGAAALAFLLLLDAPVKAQTVSGMDTAEQEKVSSTPVSGAPGVFRGAFQLGYPMVLNNDDIFKGVIGIGLEGELLVIPYIHPIVGFAYGRFDVDVDVLIFEVSGDSNVYSFTGGLRLRPIPLDREAVSPYFDFQAGYFYMEGGSGDLRLDSNNFGLRTGGGLEFGMTRNVALGLKMEYARVFDEEEDLDSLNFLGTFSMSF